MNESTMRRDVGLKLTLEFQEASSEMLADHFTKALAMGEQRASFELKYNRLVAAIVDELNHAIAKGGTVETQAILRKLLDGCKSVNPPEV